VSPRDKLCEYFKKTTTLVKIPLDKLEWIRSTEEEFYKAQDYMEKLAEETYNKTQKKETKKEKEKREKDIRQEAMLLELIERKRKLGEDVR